jgi:hypothetical protein
MAHRCFCALQEEDRREARCRVARPWLASPSILFFLSRPEPSHHAALFSKNPVPPLLLRPLQLLLLLLALATLLLIVDIAIAVVDLAKLLLPFFFGSVCSVLALYVSIYMLCWRRLHKWRTPRGLVVGATTVISNSLVSFLIYGCSCRHQYPVSVILLCILLVLACVKLSCLALCRCLNRFLTFLFPVA